MHDNILLPGLSYTAVAFGSLASIRGLALVDEHQGLNDDEIRVRAVHAADGVGEVDIWNVTAGSAPAPLYENVGYGAAGEYLDIPAGAYSIGFDVDNDMSPDLVFDLPALDGGTVATLFAVNDGGSVSLVAQLTDGSTAMIGPRM